MVATAGGGLDAELRAVAQAARARQAFGDGCYREAAAASADMFASCHAAALQVEHLNYRLLVPDIFELACVSHRSYARCCYRNNTPYPNTPPLVLLEAHNRRNIPRLRLGRGCRLGGIDPSPCASACQATTTSAALGHIHTAL